MNVSRYVRRAGALVALAASSALAQAPPMQVGQSVWVKFFASGDTSETQVSRGRALWKKCGPKMVWGKFYTGPDSAHLTQIGGDSLAIPVPCPVVTPPVDTTPIVGAIRMDAWQPGPFEKTAIAQLGPSRWRYRLPFYGTQIDSATVSMNEATQAVMDQEIAYAHAAGLDFWCFNHNITPVGALRESLNLYLSSTHKSDINFCLQMGALGFRIPDAVALMKEPTYQKVLGGRPLVFLQTFYINTYTPPDPTKADVDALRAQAIAAGLPNPYIVVENGDGMHSSYAAADADRYGADAISHYMMGIGNSSGGLAPFSQLAANAEQEWNTFKATGKKVVPVVMTGWDPRPDTTRLGEHTWAQATPQEIASHLQHAVTWVKANPGATAANVIQIYAWNEITEGGWLLPSNTAFNPVGTGRLNAIASVLGKTVDTLPKPPPSAGHPHEPPGFAPLSPPLSGDVQPPTAEEFLAGSVNDIGWIRQNTADKVTDLSSPSGSANVLETRFPSGMIGGGAPVSVYNRGQNWPQHPRSMYQSFWYKVSPNFPMNLVANKVVYTGIGQSRSVAYIDIGSSADYKLVNGAAVFDPFHGTPEDAAWKQRQYDCPVWAVVNLQGIVRVDGSVTTAINLGQNAISENPLLWKQLIRGQWHHIETLYVANTGNNLDGTVRLWLDGVLVVDFTNRVQFTKTTIGLPDNDSWSWTSWTPVYGGGGSIPSDGVGGYHRLKDFYVSGPAPTARRTPTKQP